MTGRPSAITAAHHLEARIRAAGNRHPDGPPIWLTPPTTTNERPQPMPPRPPAPGDVLPASERCRRCGGSLAFVQTAKSATAEASPKYFPLDPAPNTNAGNVQLTAGAGGRLVGHVRTGLELEALHRAGDPLYVAHFATCPKGPNR